MFKSIFIFSMGICNSHTESETTQIPNKKTGIDQEFEEALSTGKIKPLRLASFDENKKINIQSVDHEFSDEYFANIGICSYTWGHARVDWYDKETGLTWKVSDRAEKMCCAALQFFDKVWIDGLCMVQAWPEHIKLNMKFMGKLYFHGTVVTEMGIGLQPEYCYRGWVQQEISFTKVLCVIKPLHDFVNSTAGKEEVEFVTQNKAFLKIKLKGQKSPFEGRYNHHKLLLDLFSKLKIYLLGLQRIIQGRAQENLDEDIEEIYGSIDGIDFYLCSDDSSELTKTIAIQYVYSLFARLIENIPTVVKLPRATGDANVLTGAISSYRTGFFRFNSDRQVASFSLAEYVLGEEPGSLSKRLNTFIPELNGPLVDVIIANPGIWCTGLQPTAILRSVKLADFTKIFFPFMSPKIAFSSDKFEEISKKSNLDKLFSIIHSVDVCKFDKYEYVLALHKIDDMTYSIYLGIRNTAVPDSPVFGLVNVNTSKQLSFFVSNTIIGSSNEWAVRAVALLNSSYHVYCLGSDEHTISQPISDIHENKNLPQGNYFRPIFGAIQYIEYALGAMSQYATYNPIDGEHLSTERLARTIYKGKEEEVIVAIKTVSEFSVVWGSNSWDHIEI